MFLPLANSEETYNASSIGNSSQYDVGNQKLQQKNRSSGLHLLTFAIVLVIVLIGGVGSVLAYQYFHNKPASGSAAVATATPAPTAAATLAPTATPTASASATPAATLTPTVGATVTATTPTQGIVPTSPALPLTIPCVNCSYPKLTLVLNSITPDQANPSQTTDWNFTITNNGSISCSSANFNQIQLEDPSMTYQGQGQAGDTWTMNTGQQQIESPSFQIVPVSNSGVHYILNVHISLNSCNDGGSPTNTYQTESLTF